MPRSLRLLALALLLGQNPVAACRRPPDPDPVILSIDNQILRRSAFEQHLATVESRGEVDHLTPAVRSALLDAYLEERVLVLEARSKGLLQETADSAQEEAAVETLLAAVTSKVPAVQDDEVAAYYAAHREEFEIPETVVVSQILVPTSNEARDVLRRLAKDPRSFEKLARSRSRSPEASEGGLMGAFSRGELPKQLEDVAFALRPGGARIVETPMGYHVLRVDERRPARQQSLPECRDEIRARLTRERKEEAVRQYVRELMARAKVNHEAAQDPRGRL